MSDETNDNADNKVIDIKENVTQYIYRASIRTKDGNIIFAKNYNIKAFKIPVSEI